MWLRETRAIQWIQMQGNAISECPAPEVHCLEENKLFTAFRTAHKPTIFILIIRFWFYQKLKRKKLNKRQVLEKSQKAIELHI